MKTKLILVDLSADLCAAWADHFGSWLDVVIVNGPFESLPVFDCMVSAANSFGLMDGGVDGAITRFFGDALKARVQERILHLYCGEQPVGTSLILHTGNLDHPYLAHTPTMRVPMSIAGTDAVYRAMWAMLLAVRRHNQGPAGETIQTIACPGLGTMAGRVPPQEAARQMAAAYRHFQAPPDHISWEYAMARQNAVLGEVAA